MNKTHAYSDGPPKQIEVKSIREEGRLKMDKNQNSDNATAAMLGQFQQDQDFIKRHNKDQLKKKKTTQKVKMTPVTEN